MFKKGQGKKDEEETIGDEIDLTKNGRKEIANKTPTRQISSSLADIRRRPQQLIKLTQSEMNPRPKEGDLSDLEMDSIPTITSIEEESSKEALRRRSKQLEQIFTRDHSKMSSSEHALKLHLFKPQAQNDKLEPLITKEVLEAIEPQFSKSPLNSREFTKLLCEKLTLDETMARCALPHLFLSIDAYATGTVSWPELCEHLMQEYVQRTSWEVQVTHIGLRLPGKVIAGRPHRSALPRKAMDLGLSSFLMFGEDGQTSTWDQNMELKKTKSLRTPVLEKERPFSKWFTDLVMIPGTNKLAVSTGDKELLFYEMPLLDPLCALTELQGVPRRLDAAHPDADKIMLMFADMEGGINVLSIRNSTATLRKWGETKKQLGFPTTTFESALKHCQVVFNRWQVHKEMVYAVRYFSPMRQVISCSTDPETSIVIGCAEAPHGTLKPSRRRKLRAVVEQVMSIHLKHGHHVFVNARMRPPGEQIVYKVPCGVHTLDVWEEKRIMAAGGIDRAVRLWTISTKGNPFMTLYGHTYPIHKVLFIPHLNVLISITTKLNIRIWDLVEYHCMASVNPTMSYLRGHTIHLFHYSMALQRLVVQTNYELITFAVERVKIDDESRGSHRSAVVGVSYNEVFHVWVTCSVRHVKVWDVVTGKKVFEFCAGQQAAIGPEYASDTLKEKLENRMREIGLHSESGSRPVGSNVGKTARGDILTQTGYERMQNMMENATKPSWQRQNKLREKALTTRFKESRSKYVPELVNPGEITCMAMERGERRLLTGHRNGVVKEWNFSNGMCLRTLFRTGKAEEKVSTAVRYVKFSRCDNIVSVGWNWRVNIYESGREKSCEPAVTWTQDAGHKSDIWAVAICDPGIMATGSFDGTIILWNYTSGHEEKQLRPPDFRAEEGKDSTKVTCLMFYQTEKISGEVDTFLLSAGPNNAIHMWQVCWRTREVRYSGKLQPWRNRDRFVCAMVPATATDNVVVGDSSGHVIFLDMEGVQGTTSKTAYKPPPPPSTRPNLSGAQRFTSTLDNRPIRRMNEELRNPRRPADDTDVVGSRDMPVICQMWKAHSSGISDLDVCESLKIIATGSTDGSVRIWTYEGQYIGMLGQPKEWNIINPKTFMHPRLPRDVLTDLDDAYDAGLDPTESNMEEVLSKPEHPEEEGSQSVEKYSDEQIDELVKDYEVFEMVLPPYLRYEGRNKIVYKNSLGPHKYSLTPVNTWRYRNENIF